MKKNVVKSKSFDFAVRIVNLSKFLNDNKEFVLSKQILRSGTSIGALIREPEHAESKADFIHKMSIAQKEANETKYWLDLLFKTEYIDDSMNSSMINDINELRKLIASIIITSKNNK
jgi:four helix bundle protein